MKRATLQTAQQFAGSQGISWGAFMNAAEDPNRQSRYREAYEWAMANLKRKSDGESYSHSDAWRFARKATSPFNTFRPERQVDLAHSDQPIANTTGLLTHDAWRNIDSMVIQAARPRLVAIAELEARGLTVDLGDIGTLVSNWHTASDQEAAHVSMNAGDLARRDEQENVLKGIPVPLISKTFQFDIRAILAAARSGQALDTSHAARAAALVADTEEDIFFNGATGVEFGGYTVPGLLTHAQRVQSTGADFGTVANIETSFETALSDLAAENFHGPFGVFISPVQYHQMKTRPASQSRSALEIVESWPEIEFVKLAAKVPDATAALIQLTSDVVDLGIAQDLTTVQWDSPNGMAVNLLVLASRITRLKAPDTGSAAEKGGFCELTSI